MRRRNGLATISLLAMMVTAALPANEPLTLCIVTGERPTILNLAVEIDGQELSAVWDETFAQLHAFLDQNHDGALDQSEAARLPAPFVLRQSAWTRSTGFFNGPEFATLDTNHDTRLSVDEIASSYRQKGIGTVQVGVGRTPATETLTRAILKSLDTDHDGTVVESEWRAAAETFRELDKNDDELIGPGEIVTKTVYPGAVGSYRLAVTSIESPRDPIAEKLPFYIVPPKGDVSQWLALANQQRAALSIPPLSSDALAISSWRYRADHGNGARSALQVDGDSVLTAGLVRLELTAAEISSTDPFEASMRRLGELFAESDTNANQVVDEQELKGQKSGQLKDLFTSADTDGNKELTRGELDAWLALQSQIRKGQVFLTLLDHSQGLFELLDADRDAALSVRELRSAWQRLQESQSLADAKLDLARLPWHLRGVISRGQPRSDRAKPHREGPAWFQALNRNGDGDVSPREWIEEEAAFRKLDTDHDGLLSESEARRAGE
jgi:Ca2+-binding EF-hand superfamily protein